MVLLLTRSLCDSCLLSSLGCVRSTTIISSVFTWQRLEARAPFICGRRAIGLERLGTLKDEHRPLIHLALDVLFCSITSRLYPKESSSINAPF